jgi:hypothetical protein
MLLATGRVRLLSAFMSIWCVLCIGRCPAVGQQANDLDVSVTLFRPTDEAEKDPGYVTVSYPTIAVPANVGSVTDLLDASHILADSDAIALVYLLNPSLEKIDGLTHGQNLRTIQVQLPPEAEKAVSEGFHIKINYDERLITAILSRRDEVQKLALFPAETTEQRNCLESAARDANLITDHLEARDQPLDHQVLLQLTDDFALLAQLGQTLSGSASKHPDGSETACAVAADLALKRQGFESNGRDSSFSATRWPQVRVVVRTLDAKGNPKSMLRVHWVPQALEHMEGREQQFPQLSTPTENLLPEADYVFYATQGDDHTVLGKVSVAVRRHEGSQPFTVDIQVTQP